MRLYRMLTCALLLLYPAAVQAQTFWDMPTEYPQSAMAGLGVTTFTRHVAELSVGRLQVRPSFDATSGIKSADMLWASLKRSSRNGMRSPTRWKLRTRSSLCPRYRFW